MTAFSAKPNNHEVALVSDTKLGKPKRPLSAYNLFYKFDRERLLQGTDNPASATDVLRLSLDDKNKPKRSHRKTHGKMSFLAMSKTISARWKRLPKGCKKVFEDQAAIEKNEYDDKLRTWREQKSKESNSQEAFGVYEIEEADDNMSVPTTKEAPEYVEGCLTTKHHQESLISTNIRAPCDDLQAARDRVDKALAKGDDLQAVRDRVDNVSVPTTKEAPEYAEGCLTIKHHQESLISTNIRAPCDDLQAARDRVDKALAKGDDLQAVRDRVDKALADFIPTTRPIANSVPSHGVQFSSQRVKELSMTAGQGILPPLQIWAHPIANSVPSHGVQFSSQRVRELSMTAGQGILTPLHFSTQRIRELSITAGQVVLTPLQIWEGFGCAAPFESESLDTLFE